MGGVSDEEFYNFVQAQLAQGRIKSGDYQALIADITFDVSAYFNLGNEHTDNPTLFERISQTTTPELLANDSQGGHIPRSAVESGERFNLNTYPLGSYQKELSNCAMRQLGENQFQASSQTEGNCYLVFANNDRYTVVKIPQHRPQTTTIMAQVINSEDGASASGNRVNVNVPAFALPDNVNFTVQEIEEDVTTELGRPVLSITGGLNFNLPVRIGVNYVALGIENPWDAVWRLNNNSEPLMPVAVSDGVVYFEIMHTQTATQPPVNARRAKAREDSQDLRLYVSFMNFIKPLYPIELPITPVKFVGTPETGDRLNSDKYFRNFGTVHGGTDLAINRPGFGNSGIQSPDTLGKKVYPICPGEITEINNVDNVENRWILVKHDRGCAGFESLMGAYMHLDTATNLKIGDRVNRDKQLGTVAYYPQSAEHHLHLTLFKYDNLLPAFGRKLKKEFQACVRNFGSSINPFNKVYKIRSTEDNSCEDETHKQDIYLSPGYGRISIWNTTKGNTIQNQYNITRDAMHTLGYIGWFEIDNENRTPLDTPNDSFVVNLTSVMAGQGIESGMGGFTDAQSNDRQRHELYVSGVSDKVNDRGETTPCELIDNAGRFGAKTDDRALSANDRQVTHGVLKIDSNAHVNVSVNGTEETYYRLYIDATNKGDLAADNLNGLAELKVASGYTLKPYHDSCQFSGTPKLFLSPVMATFPQRVVAYSNQVMDLNAINNATFRYGALYFAPNTTENNVTDLPCTKVTNNNVTECALKGSAVGGTYVDAVQNSTSVFAFSLAGNHQLFIRLMNQQALADFNSEVNIKLYVGSDNTGVDVEVVEKALSSSPPETNYNGWYSLKRKNITDDTAYNFDLSGKAYLVVKATGAVSLDAVRAVTEQQAVRDGVSRVQPVNLAKDTPNLTDQSLNITTQLQSFPTGATGWKNIFKGNLQPIISPVQRSARTLQARTVANDYYQYNSVLDNLKPGKYRIVYGAHPSLNLQPVVFEFEIAQNGEGTGNLPAVYLGTKGRNDVAIDVLDATTNQPIAGAKVKLYYGYTQNIESSATVRFIGEAITDAAGKLTFTNAYNGLYTMVVEKAGYGSSSSELQVGRDAAAKRFLSPVISATEARVVLRWGQDPRDLDSHLLRYTGSNLDYQVYYPLRGQLIGDAILDVDVTSGFGPETVTINPLASDKTYKYVVHHYSGSGSIASSGAVVNLVQGETNREFYPPNQSGIWWHVFDMVNGEVRSCQSNCIGATLDSVLTPVGSPIARSRRFAIEDPVLPVKE